MFYGALPLRYEGEIFDGPLRIWWDGTPPSFPFFFTVALMGFEPASFDLLTCRLPTEPCATTAWNIMQRNEYIKMVIPGWPPPLHLIQTWGSKRHIYARVITLCAVYIIHEAFTVIFECQLFCFFHVRRLEHHATAPMARLPKQTRKTQTHYYSKDNSTCGRMNEVMQLHYLNAKSLSYFIITFYF